MANRLKMAEIQAILSLKARGWSNRRIASELGVDRETVARYVRLAIELATAVQRQPADQEPGPIPKPANAPPGKTSGNSPDPAKGPPGMDQSPAPKPANAPSAADATDGSKPANAPPGKTSGNSPDPAKAPPGMEQSPAPKPANAPPAADATDGSKPAIAPPGEISGNSPKPAMAPDGNEGPGAPDPVHAAAGDDATADPKPANALPGNRDDFSSKPAIAPPGIDSPEGSNAAIAPPGNVGPEVSKPTNALTGPEWAELTKKLDELAWRIQPPEGRGRGSQCEPYRETIEAKLAIGLSAQRIYQDLKEEGFQGSVYSVQRFARKLLAKAPEAFRRLECLPGEEAQIDFGKGAPIVDGKRKRRTHVLRIVLSHSRKAYSEAVYHQTAENFLRCLENAFRYFGGVPKTLVPDNLKAAVKTPDWFDPEINPKLQSFCAHYGTVVLPTKPRTPRHKGKVESGVGYVQGNALKGRTFSSLEEQNRHLLQWEQGVADRRIHGTIKRQVGPYFEEVERAALLPLPTDPFPCFQEARRMVHRDGHIEVAKAYYSVPPEYVGRPVWARWDARLVRVYNGRMEQIALHARQEPGKHATARQHLSDHKISMVEEGAESLLMRAARIGPKTKQWAETMFEIRGIEGVRVLVGLVSLPRKHQVKDIEDACDTALTYGAYRLRTIRQLIGKNAPKQQTLEFLDEHPIIRRLEDYGALVRDVFNKEVSQ